ncbi:MFS transporter [Streptacidiphilus fuscans]|uniref:MFS transporter n=1 Tax=Streptacidiphilus fuscans TaxID=2789292 RepID=A0A931BBR5_9ACTN|nr:MFS transporter [Streptacidiphilus fuscans]MBF9072342.1 MFS transporter [Streptacidiphilus fuscans]
MLPRLLVRRSGFRWFFSGQLVSLLGSSMAPVALAFAVLNASGRPDDLGIVLAARMVPLLAFLLIGGATADRLPRRTVLVAANLGSGLTQGAVAVLLLTGNYSLPAVATLEFLNGLLAAFTTPALRGLLPELVATEELQQANSLLSSVKNGTRVFGPSISGLLVVAVGGGPAIACDALSYLVAAVCLTRLPAAPRDSSSRAARGTLRRDLREGWTVFRGTPWVWTVTTAFCVTNLVQTGTWQILGPQLTKQLSSEATWGFLLSARALGMLLMSALMYRLVLRHLLRAGQLAAVFAALPLLAIGTGLRTPWVIAAGFVGGLGLSVTLTAWDTSLQEHIPARVLSRVASYDDLLSYIAIPIGQLAVGPLAQRFGGFQVMTAAGLCYVVVVLLPLASPVVRGLPHAIAGATTPQGEQTPHDQPVEDEPEAAR